MTARYVEYQRKLPTLTMSPWKERSSARVNSRYDRSIKDITKTLQGQFTAPKVPLSLPPECRRILQNFVEEQYGEVRDESSTRANLELKSFWEKYVGDGPYKLGAWAGVLRVLRPTIGGEANILEWWQLVLRPIIIGSSGYKRPALEDAREFLIATMVRDDDGEVTPDKAATIDRLCGELLTIYTTRTRGVSEEDNEAAAADNAQVAQQVEEVLLAFGRKRPKDLFHRLDDLVNVASTRLQSLTLLSSFLRQQTPHLYLVINTPLVEHLLKCLMNDTSTTVLSVALTSLIMLLPHIPGSLGSYLPRMFLVYSRLLCWEKFSPLSSVADRNLVTDDRIANDSDSDNDGAKDVGIDTNWDKLQPDDDAIEAATPELMTYFTYLYGLYPLNFMSYIRKPRRYLKNIDFPGADAFDLDQAVIRSRTEQFRQVHLLHPNFYNLTVEEELIDPKWPKMDPADVVGQCHGLCMMSSKPPLTSPGPPPTSRLPDIPPVPPLSASNTPAIGHISPAVSHTSLRSGNSWRDTQSSTGVSGTTAEGESPLLKPRGLPSDEDVLPEHPRPRTKQSGVGTHPSPTSDSLSQQGAVSTSIASPNSREKSNAVPQTNFAYLQQEITLLRNDLSFERWHKAQYSQHIGQIMRRNVKEATVEAQTLNLINANRALQKQLDQVRKAREATVKDSALTRKQANSLEANVTERFHKLKLEQETWQADADELRRLRGETKQYRELLVATEARELNKAHQLEIAQRHLQHLQALQSQLQNAKRRLHEYEYQEFEFDNAKRQAEILQGETQNLQAKIHRQEQEQGRIRQAYANKVTELETQLGLPNPISRQSSSHSGPDVHAFAQQAVSESQAKLAQLKKAHSKLLERHTDLELEYHSVKSRLDTLQGNRSGQSFFNADNDHETFSYDIINDYTPSESAYSRVSTSDPTNRRFQSPLRGSPVMPPVSQAATYNYAGLMFEPSMSRNNSIASGNPSTAAFNQSAPLSQDEGRSAFSGDSETGGSKKEKIQPDSTVRVYGRGKVHGFLSTKSAS